MLIPHYYYPLNSNGPGLYNYARFEELTGRGVVYVTKMRKDLKYDVLVDCMLQMPQGLMGYREQTVAFRKGNINHMARIITYVDIKKGKRPKFVSVPRGFCPRRQPGQNGSNRLPFSGYARLSCRLH